MYKLVTSIKTSVIFSVTLVFSIRLATSVVSFKYDSLSLVEIRSVGPSQHDLIGLPTALGF